MAVNAKGNRLDDGGSVAVDYVWGNFPLQPDDERQTSALVNQIGGTTGDYGWSATTQVASIKLDETLDNHSIATDGRFGFPGYTPGYIGDGDAIANVVVPNVVGLSLEAAATAIVAAGLTWGVVTTSAGATEQNDGLVSAQNPAAGANVNYGDEIALTQYEYVAGIQVDLAGLIVFVRGANNDENSVNGYGFTIETVPTDPLYVAVRNNGNLQGATGGLITISNLTAGDWSGDATGQLLLDNEGLALPIPYSSAYEADGVGYISLYGEITGIDINASYYATATTGTATIVLPA